jgi:hypothetical protein
MKRDERIDFVASVEGEDGGMIGAMPWETVAASLVDPDLGHRLRIPASAGMTRV